MKPFHLKGRVTLSYIGLILTPFLSSFAIAAQPSQGYKAFKISVSQINTQNTEVANADTELQRDSLLLSAGVNIPLNQQWSVGLKVGYDRLNYDWRNVGISANNASAILFNDLNNTWEDIDRYRASISVNYRLDKHWSLMLAPQIQYAYADTASASDALSYGVVASAMYGFDSGNMLGFGMAYLNDIDEVRIMPYLTMRWQINERWRLANPFQAGFSGPAGLELSYQLTPEWNIGFGNSRRTERFLIAGRKSVVEMNEWVSYLRAGWQVTPVISLNGYAGYYFNGELEVSQQGELEIENQGSVALAFEFSF